MTSASTRKDGAATLGDLLAREAGAVLDLGPSSSTTVFVAVRDRLQLGILTGEFAPGEKLHQAEIAVSLGVSITPVREALRELSAAGLVDFVANMGAVVHSPTAIELEVLGEMLMALLPLVVSHSVAQITDAELTAAERLCLTMDEPLAPARWVETNRGFHNLLNSACGNRHLSKSMSQVNDLMQLYVKLDVDTGAGRRNHEHHELLQAYRGRDSARALEVYQSHLGATVAAAARVLSSG
jgi:DNA-binding GntR family transcriptional regulator